MVRAILILFLILFAVVSGIPAQAGDAPDFAWGARMGDAVRAPLRQAEMKWNEAAAVPACPAMLSIAAKRNPDGGSKSFDEAYLREVIAREGFACDLLDTAMRKLRLIDECKSLYKKAVAQAGRRAPASVSRFDDAFCPLRSRIRLAIGVSRAAISQEMARKTEQRGGDVSNYCFQAMESAIDVLRDAASDAEKATGGSVRAEPIRRFRSRLFEVWEDAQRSKDTRVIGAIDLARMWDAAGLGKQADTR